MKSSEAMRLGATPVKEAKTSPLLAALINVPLVPEEIDSCPKVKPLINCTVS
jgi:hypothetical protein